MYGRMGVFRELTKSGEYRFILLEEDEDTEHKSVFNIFETVDKNENDVWSVISDIMNDYTGCAIVDGDFVEPDCLTLREAVEAACPATEEIL